MVSEYRAARKCVGEIGRGLTALRTASSLSTNVTS